jgi:hypothetical protein
VQQETAENSHAGRRPRPAWPWIAGPLAAFIVLVALILATGTPSSASLMQDATTSFGKVKRGNFRFAISIVPHGTGSAAPSTIALGGPFELVPGKPLPVARITYTVSSGGRSQVVTLLTTGDKAYSVVKGQAYELPPSETKQLKAATKDLAKPGRGGGLSGINLHFGRWLVAPQVAAGREIDGTPTWRTAAKVDVVEALKDMIASAGTLGSITGQGVPALKESQIKEIKKGIHNASVVVYVGRYDNILRLMDLTMDFTTPASQQAATGGITGGRMNMVVGISQPNRPVDVKPPKDPLPYTALQSLSGSQTGTTLDDGLGR